MKSYTLKEIKEKLGIDSSDIDSYINISGPAKIENAEQGEIASLHNPKYEKLLYDTKASAVFVPENFKPKNDIGDLILIKTSNPLDAFAEVINLFYPYEKLPAIISDKATIEKNCQIGENVWIGDYSYISPHCKIGNDTKIFPQVYIGVNAEIGENCFIYPGVKIYANVKIGNNCTIHSGAVIGADGFGFTHVENNEYKKIKHAGGVIIEDNVEIGANACIDRATLGNTIIRKGVKIDNLVQVGHNVEIGANTVIAGQAGISESTKIGNNCMIGGQAGFAGHLKIAPYTKVNGQSGVISSVNKENQFLYGTPALEYLTFLRSYSVFKKLDSLQKKVENLEKKLSCDEEEITE